MLNDRLEQLHSPPEVYLPCDQLPSLSNIQRLKAVWPTDPGEYTELTIKNGSAVLDIALANLIHLMPRLQVINLKGCSLAGSRTVEQILKLTDVKKVNLKGTKVDEGGVKAILERFGQQLEAFKVDNVVIEVGSVCSFCLALP